MPDIVVKVRLLQGETYEFTVDDSMTVQEFRVHVADTVNIEADQQRLIFQGKVLQDHFSLCSCDVDGKVIHLVTRPPPRPNAANASTASTTERQTNSSHAGSGWQSRLTGGMRIPSLSVPFERNQAPPSRRYSRARMRLRYFRRIERIVRGILEHLANPTESPLPTSSDRDNLSVPIYASPGLHDILRNSAQGASTNQVDLTQVFQDNPSASADMVDSVFETVVSTNMNDTDDDGTTGEGTAPTLQQSCPNVASSADTGADAQTELQRPLDVSALADMMATYQELYATSQTHISTWCENLRYISTAVLTDEERQRYQSSFELISRLIHLLSHQLHLLSDFMIATELAPPRHLMILSSVPLMQQMHTAVQIDIMNPDSEPTVLQTPLTVFNGGVNNVNTSLPNVVNFLHPSSVADAASGMGRRAASDGNVGGAAVVDGHVSSRGSTTAVNTSTTADSHTGLVDNAKIEVSDTSTGSVQNETGSTEQTTESTARSVENSLTTNSSQQQRQQTGGEPASRTARTDREAQPPPFSHPVMAVDPYLICHSRHFIRNPGTSQSDGSVREIVASGSVTFVETQPVTITAGPLPSRSLPANLSPWVIPSPANIFGGIFSGTPSGMNIPTTSCNAGGRGPTSITVSNVNTALDMTTPSSRVVGAHVFTDRSQNVGLHNSGSTVAECPSYASSVHLRFYNAICRIIESLIDNNDLSDVQREQQNLLTLFNRFCDRFIPPNMNIQWRCHFCSGFLNSIVQLMASNLFLHEFPQLLTTSECNFARRFDSLRNEMQTFLRAMVSRSGHVTTVPAQASDSFAMVLAEVMRSERDFFLLNPPGPTYSTIEALAQAERIHRQHLEVILVWIWRAGSDSGFGRILWRDIIRWMSSYVAFLFDICFGFVSVSDSDRLLVISNRILAFFIRCDATTPPPNWLRRFVQDIVGIFLPLLPISDGSESQARTRTMTRTLETTKRLQSLLDNGHYEDDKLISATTKLSKSTCSTPLIIGVSESSNALNDSGGRKLKLHFDEDISDETGEWNLAPARENPIPDSMMPAGDNRLLQHETEYIFNGWEPIINHDMAVMQNKCEETSSLSTDCCRSDAYICGLPAKKRKVIQSKKQHSLKSKDDLLSECLETAEKNLSNSSSRQVDGVVPQTTANDRLSPFSEFTTDSVSQLTSVVAETTALASPNTPRAPQNSIESELADVFGDYVRSRLHERLVNDPDFDLNRFPNAYQLFMVDMDDVTRRAHTH